MLYTESTDTCISSAKVMLDGPISTLKMYSPDLYSNFTTYLSRNKRMYSHPRILLRSRAFNISRYTPHGTPHNLHCRFNFPATHIFKQLYMCTHHSKILTSIQERKTHPVAMSLSTWWLAALLVMPLFLSMYPHITSFPPSFYLPLFPLLYFIILPEMSINILLY